MDNKNPSFTSRHVIEVLSRCVLSIKKLCSIKPIQISPHFSPSISLYLHTTNSKVHQLKNSPNQRLNGKRQSTRFKPRLYNSRCISIYIFAILLTRYWVSVQRTHFPVMLTHHSCSLSWYSSLRSRLTRSRVVSPATVCMLTTKAPAGSLDKKKQTQHKDDVHRSCVRNYRCSTWISADEWKVRN